jgi:hypothetical protein
MMTSQERPAEALHQIERPAQDLIRPVHGQVDLLNRREACHLDAALPCLAVAAQGGGYGGDPQIFISHTADQRIDEMRGGGAGAQPYDHVVFDQGGSGIGGGAALGIPVHAPRTFRNTLGQ